MIRELAFFFVNESRQDVLPDQYIPGRIKFNFSLNTSLRVASAYQTESYDYEDRIIKFICGDPSDIKLNAGRILIIRGATGAGKSTTLKHCINLAKQRLSDGGSLAPLNTAYLHFSDVSQILFEGNDQDDNRFIWSYVSNHIENEFLREFQVEEELGEYLIWLQHQPKILALLKDFSLFIDSHKKQIECYAKKDGLGDRSNAQLFEFLLDEFSKTVQKIDDRQRAKYKIVKFLYRLKKKSAGTSRNILIFDNIDHLPPHNQSQIINIAIWISDFLNIPLIIAVRPLTWENVHGDHILNAEEHLAPSLTDVIKAALTKYENKLSPSHQFRVVLRKFAAELDNERSHLRRLIYGTSGLSIRAGLRNFANFLESPIVEDEYKKTNSVELQPSILSRAFFFSTGSKIKEDSLENLFALTRTRDPRIALLKPRIIDYVYRIKDGRANTDRLMSFISKFGYHDDLILLALNALLTRKRALLWSDKNHRFKNLQELREGHTIAIAPIGVSYFDRLFGEYFYTECCLAESRGETVPTEIVVHFSRDLINEDERQIKEFVKNMNAVTYCECYPREMPSLAFNYWSSFEKGAPHRINREHGSVQIDMGWRNRILKFCHDNVDAGFYDLK